MDDDARVPQRKTPRREQILRAALELFDERGISAVSTNHIAERAGISPGNLYYWFPNRASIVRALFERWSARSTMPDVEGESPAGLLRILFHAMRRQVVLTDEYRVIARELVTLLHEDDELARSYAAAYEERIDRLERMLALLQSEGLLLEPAPPTTTRDLVVASWILSESAPSFLSAVGAEQGTAGVDAGAITTALLLAHLTPAGRLVLAADLKEASDAASH